MSTSPFIIENLNLSETWVSALRKITDNGGSEITPLIVTITDFEESIDIHKALNSDLAKHKLPTLETVSDTIFPQGTMEYLQYTNRYTREELYRAYKKDLPRYKKIDKSNANGTYFERMISYGNKDEKINQLEIIITSLIDNTIKRRSKLQASIFDPTKDHTNKPFQGFPCLQHVTFYKSETGGLVLNSFYAIQYLYRRAYGNWLGLINLGKFVAQEAGLEFERFNCFIGVEHLDHIKKNEAKKLLTSLDLMISVEG
jgi:thymidylate synthase